MEIQNNPTYDMKGLTRYEMRLVEQALSGYEAQLNDPGNHDRSTVKELLRQVTMALTGQAPSATR